MQSRDRTGKAEGVEADDARDRGVRWGRGSIESCEQSETRGETRAKAPPKGKLEDSTTPPTTRWNCASQRIKQLRPKCRHVREYNPREEQDGQCTRTDLLADPRKLRSYRDVLTCSANPGYILPPAWPDNPVLLTSRRWPPWSILESLPHLQP